ncbi:Transcription factor bHLH30 [Platanthera guangdongensis]|uniref:Transcription factor bHLH30 n=1 Tax=Platanthera guangdongensis TaxID=2320717 RepID=A0ABR2MX23_9ASPA
MKISPPSPPAAGSPASLQPAAVATDKASLLAEVIQHVKELKRQTSEIVDDNHHHHHLLPTESDELTVDATSDDDGRLLVTASLCCEDRSDLLPEVIKALKALRLRTIKAEITTLGGRLKNVLVITADDPLAADSTPDKHPQQCSVSSIQDALKPSWSGVLPPPKSRTSVMRSEMDG